MGLPTTEEWALSLGISKAPTPPAVAGHDEPCAFTARQIATRAIVLYGVTAVACGVDCEPVAEWFRDQGLWETVSPNERELLRDAPSMSREATDRFHWRQEAAWALLWTVGKVEALGLPTRQCDTRRLVDEIVPALGSDLEPFLASATMRSPGELLAEDDRHYDLWCRYAQSRRSGIDPLPADLDASVLYQRQYAFEWLHGIEAWDDVRCDA